MSFFEGPDAADLGFELIPAADAGRTPEEELEAAVADALGQEIAATEGGAPVPFGRSPVFDYEARRFVRRGAAPAWARGTGAVQQWVLATLNSARFAHAIYDDEHGVEDLEEHIGALDDLSLPERISRALVQHDRIAAVEDINVERDPHTGSLYIRSMSIVLDDDDRLLLGGDAEDLSLD